MRARDKKARDGVATASRRVRKRVLKDTVEIDRTNWRAARALFASVVPTRTTDAVSDFAGKKMTRDPRFASPRKVDFEKAPVVRRFAFGSSRPTAGRGHR
jgi:hypothetical protein